MSNEEILKKAIEKALKGGFKYVFGESGYIYFCEQVISFDNNEHYAVIFSRNFAKAFWGKEVRETFKVRNDKWHENVIEWKYQLQQMVLEKEPLKYLKKFL